MSWGSLICTVTTARRCIPDTVKVSCFYHYHVIRSVTQCYRGRLSSPGVREIGHLPCLIPRLRTGICFDIATAVVT
jgi:hypothetical protein